MELYRIRGMDDFAVFEGDGLCITIYQDVDYDSYFDGDIHIEISMDDVRAGGWKTLKAFDNRLFDESERNQIRITFGSNAKDLNEFIAQMKSAL